MSKEPIKSKGNYIDGRWIQGKGSALTSYDPAYKKLLWQGNHAHEEDISLAFEAAHLAFKNWSTISFEQRVHYILNFGKQIEKNRDELALLISKENGKPLWESYTEVKAIIDKINLSIQSYQERTWPKQITATDVHAFLRYKPQGIVVILGPFNFPAHLSNGHIIPALIAGNSILYKPSEQTPAVAEMIMDCWHSSQIPPGVINCLQGGAACAKLLLAQPIQGVYFTGSYSTGLTINQQFSNRPEVILALEMGGNNPLMLDKVNNLSAAIYQSLLSTLITAGQRCTCARRLIIPNNHHGDEFLEGFIKICQSIKIAAFDSQPEPFMGPVISYKEAQKHLKSQDHLIQLGGKSLLTMSSMDEDTGFLLPGIIDMTAVNNPPDEEIFAPFVQIYRYNDFEEGIKLTKQSAYGLVASLFSDNEKNYQHFFQSISAGLINWNKPTTGALSSLPFGGIGLSGNHRPSAYFAADYCSYPIASMQESRLSMPTHCLPGINIEVKK